MTTEHIAVLIVNGFDRREHFGPFAEEEARRYPWIALCLRQIARHSGSAQYDITVLDNSGLPEHLTAMSAYPRVRVVTPPRELTHAEALDELVSRTCSEDEYIVILDNDAFPVSNGWLDALIDPLREGAMLSGVYRDEMASVIRPFIHVSGLCIRRSDLLASGIRFSQNIAQDVGQNLTDAVTASGGRIHPLRRSNQSNPHFLMGGIYGDVIYHQGAGGRRPRFWLPTDGDEDERIRSELRELAFTDIDHLVSRLRGEV